MKKGKFIWFFCIIFYGVVGVISFFFLCFEPTPSDNHSINTSLYDINTELSKAEDTSSSLHFGETDSDESKEPTANFVTEEIQYTFVTTNLLTVLHVRKEPNLNAEIIYYLNPKSCGDVLEKGDSWSLIQYEDITGYVSNDYLEFHEKN